MYTRKQALALARQIRTCPSPEIRWKKEFTKENARHMDICPFCSTGLNAEIDAWHTLTTNLENADFYEDSSDQFPEIQTGQIRKVRQGLGVWKNGYYYNAPIVLILEDRPAEGKMVRVAQIWHDVCLVSPGDLVVPSSHITGMDDILIEPWNLYYLGKKNLERGMGTVSPAVVKAVFRMIDNPDFLPDWALSPMPLTAGDARIYFRQLEAEVGRVFSGIPDLIVESVDTLIERIKKFLPGVAWPWIPKTIEECFGTLRIPSDHIPLSAASDDTMTIPGARVCVDQGRLISISGVVLPVRHEKKIAGRYVLTGDIPDTADIPESAIFRCYLENRKKRFLSEGHWSWDEKNRYFMIRFETEPAPSDRIAVVIFDL